jgi:hypothetical protein
MRNYRHVHITLLSNLKCGESFLEGCHLQTSIFIWSEEHKMVFKDRYHSQDLVRCYFIP